MTFHTLGLLAQKSTVEIDSAVFVTGEIEAFIPAEHHLDTCTTIHHWKAICLIDSQPFYGTDLGLDPPINKLVSLELKLYSEKIPLDVSYMYNASTTGSLYIRQFKLIKGEVGYFLYGMFSDGAGTYTAYWHIIKDQSIRTNISMNEDDFFWHFK